MAQPVRLPPGSGSLQEPLGRLRGEADEAAHGVQFLRPLVLRDIAAGKESTQDTTTLEDFSVLAKLRTDEE